jgi:site-specific DNA recombinase
VVVSRWGKERRARDKKPILGYVPIGYSYENGQLKVEEAEAVIVRRIFEMYISGHGTWTIAKQLTADGVLTKYDRSGKGYHKKREIGEWSPSSIVGILRNRTYVGEMAWNKRRFKEPEHRKGERNPQRPKTAAEMRDPSEWFPIPVDPIITRADHSGGDQHFCGLPG